MHDIFDITQTSRSLPFDKATNGWQAENAQEAIEEHGLHILGEIPTGLKNGINLTYTTAFEFIPGSLEVFLSGINLINNGSDRDFDVAIDNKGFTILIAPTLSHRLNTPPRQREPLVVNYRKKIPTVP
jgi:hypothetical protein